MVPIKVVVCTLLCAGSVRVANCACEKSFVVICENLSDVQFNSTKRSWSELLIQPSHENTPKLLLTPQQLSGDLSNLKWLIINNHLKGVTRKAFTYLKYIHHIILYGNFLEVIKEESFFAFKKLQKLGLENNSIHRLEKNAFSGSTIDTVDMSYNNIEVLISGVFSRRSYVNTLRATHNQLWRIETNSLPKTLKRLHLDYNRFQGIPDELGNLQLEELTLSRNGIVSTSGLKHLRALSKLDISFNRIESLSDEFDNMGNLLYLDLSSNMLEKLTFTPRFVRNIRQATENFRFLLAHNLLRNLDLHQIRDVTVTLSGNPWNCKCAEDIQRTIKNNNITKTACDHMMFSGGQHPYCIGDVHSCSEEKVSDQLFRKFKNSFKNQPCDIFTDVAEFVEVIN